MKIVERMKSNFVYLKYSFCRPLNSASRGGRTTCPCVWYFERKNEHHVVLSLGYIKRGKHLIC